MAAAKKTVSREVAAQRPVLAVLSAALARAGARWRGSLDLGTVGYRGSFIGGGPPC